MQFPRKNNLQWLRLLFAAQVAVMHSFHHLTGTHIPFLDHFPGVPAFFFVSGFLIYASYLNAPGRTYFENRFLRLFPGLLLVTLGGGIVALIAHGSRDLIEHPSTYLSWLVAQITLGQAYNPSLFRDVGVGVINGSLWTITAEILFYLCVPIIVWMEQRVRWTVPALVCLSFLIYALGPNHLDQTVYGDKTLYDVLALTPIVWGWMFGCGILAVKYFRLIARYINLMPIAVLPMIGMIALNSDSALLSTNGNELGLLYFLCYVSLVLWLAFGIPVHDLKPDLSYGLYVWHMPVVNLLLVVNLAYVPAALLISAGLAAASWFLIERPSLRFKRRSIHPETKSGEGVPVMGERSPVSP